MADTRPQIVQDIDKTGKVDAMIVAHMDSSVAIFGDLYAKNKDRINALPADQQYSEIKELAHKSAELSPAAPYSNTSLVKHDIDVLIADSKKLDEPGKEGAHLKAWAQDVSVAVKDVDFKKIYHDDGTQLSTMEALGAKNYMDSLGKAKVDKIRGEIRASAEKNISPDFKTQSLQENLVANIRADAKKADAKDSEKGAFSDVTTEDPKPRGMGGMGGGIMQLILGFIGMLLGIDLSGMLGGNQQQQQDAQQQAGNAGIAVIPTELEKKLDALISPAQKLHDGKATPDDIKAVAAFSGAKEEDLNKLTPDAKAKLGKDIIDGVEATRNGAKTEDGLKTDVQKFSQDKANQASITPPAPQKGEERQVNTGTNIGKGETTFIADAAGSGTLVHVGKIEWDKVDNIVNGMPKVTPDAPLASGAADLGKLAPASAVAVAPAQQKGQNV